MIEQWAVACTTPSDANTASRAPTTYSVHSASSRVLAISQSQRFAGSGVRSAPGIDTREEKENENLHHPATFQKGACVLVLISNQTLERQPSNGLSLHSRQSQASSRRTKSKLSTNQHHNLGQVNQLARRADQVMPADMNTKQVKPAVKARVNPCQLHVKNVWAGEWCLCYLLERKG